MALRLHFCYLNRPIFIKDIGLGTVTAIMLCYVTSRCHIMFSCYMLCYGVTLCFVLLLYVMLYCVLCYVLCCVMLCYVLLPCADVKLRQADLSS